MPIRFSNKLKREYTNPKDENGYSSEHWALTPSDLVLEHASKRITRIHAYRELERDAKVFATVEKRKSMVVGSETLVRAGQRRGMSPTRADKKARDFIEECLRLQGQLAEKENAGASMIGGQRDMIYGILDGVLIGYSVTELMMERDGRYVVPVNSMHREPNRFFFDGEHRLRYRTRKNYNGITLPAGKFLVFTWGSTSDPYGRGLGHQLWWLVFFKRQGIQFWTRFLDKYGGPTVVGKYPQHWQQEQITELADAVRAVNQRESILVDDMANIELLQAISTAAQAGFREYESFIDNQIAQAVLGVTLTTEITGQASRAAAEVHGGDQWFGPKHDAARLGPFLTATYSTTFTNMNFNGAVPPIIEKRLPKTAERAVQAEIDTKIYAMGYERTEESVNKVYADEPGEFVKKEVPEPLGGGFPDGNNPDPDGNNPSDDKKPDDGKPDQNKSKPK